MDSFLNFVNEYSGTHFGHELEDITYLKLLILKLLLKIHKLDFYPFEFFSKTSKIASNSKKEKLRKLPGKMIS
jgi:hypothetical protein